MTSQLSTEDHPTFGDILADVDPVIDTVFVAGPPVIPLGTAGVLFGLLLAGPFALFATLVLAIIAAWALLALVVAILASPFILFRHLRGRRAARAAHARATQTAAQPAAQFPTPQLASIRSQQVAA